VGNVAELKLTVYIFNFWQVSSDTTFHFPKSRQVPSIDRTFFFLNPFSFLSFSFFLLHLQALTTVDVTFLVVEQVQRTGSIFGQSAGHQRRHLFPQ